MEADFEIAAGLWLGSAADRPGRSESDGPPQGPWTGAALGPAGGIRASILDLARLIGALLAETAPPSTRALDPVEHFAGPAVCIGAAWITLEHKETLITWHHGGTGGFHAWLGLDGAAGTGVAILSGISRSVDQHAR